MRKICSSDKLMRKEYGVQRAKLMQTRLTDMAAAECLEDLRFLPGRYHELENRGHDLAVDLDGPFRLIFIPAHQPAPCHDHGGLDWRQVTRIQVMGIEDYHGKKQNK